jgi:acetoin utilization protein AcuB
MMLVGERMSRPVITVRPDMPVPDALDLMKRENKHQFPVIDSRGKLLGMVSERELLNASASNVTTLSVWELSYLLSKIKVEQVMTHPVITITEDTTIEEAARIMADHNIGGLPVVQGDEVIGIITETDLFKMFLELFGARFAGVRVTMLVDNKPGKLNELTGSLVQLGVNIISIGTFMGDSSGTTGVVLKVEGAGLDDVQLAVTPHAVRIIDIRQTKVG